MTFTQYMFPNGRKVPEFIERPEPIEKLADELMDAGWSFEIECFPDTQVVHMDCCNDDGQLAVQVCKNGPDVPPTVDKMVTAAHAEWIRRGKPKASDPWNLEPQDLIG